MKAPLVMLELQTSNLLQTVYCKQRNHCIGTMNPIYLMFSVIIIFLLFGLCTSIDTLTPEQPLKDGGILLSSGETFALGFFSPPGSNCRYVGIWFNKVSVQTVVWVANRENPINGTSGVLSISERRNLIISSGNYSFPVSQANSSTSLTGEYKARLMDSGNFQLYFQGDDGGIVVVWQSFDYPTNYQLPGMKLGLNRRTGQNWFLSSWKSVDDPAVGEYSYRADPRGLPQTALYKGSTRRWRYYIGSEQDTGKSEQPPLFAATYTYVQDQNEFSWEYTLRNTSVPYTAYLDELGNLQFVTWVDGKWIIMFKNPGDQCGNFGRCGAFGYCDPSNIDVYNFECSCLPGYEPKLTQQWYTLRDTSSGCVKKRATLSMCGNGEGFVVMERIEIPDTSADAHLEMNLGLEGCRVKCLKDCSCNGFAIGGIGECITWHGNMTDVRKFPNGRLAFHVRVDHIELAQQIKISRSFLHRNRVVIVVTSVLGALVIVFSCVCWLILKRRGFGNDASTKQNVDLPVFDMVTLEGATNKFSFRNVVGEGGFGTVYKGQLLDGKDIAVKRLSVVSRQGINEFMNEVIFITKLQHRNLVRLLGCCIHGEERMLVYEYMPNGSLDSVIFGKENGSRLLTWRMRFDIILGIARGILYLHQDSRLKIIHRDLKASNVLLDDEMNPKISDFGLARVFGGDQLYEKTRNVVGTYGYMAPEYAIDGLFSVKSDMFSFGVMVLEIISGQKNRMFSHPEHDLNLLGHAWKFWIEGRAAELLDPLVEGSVCVDEVIRCIHVGLLCVQKSALDRPPISSALWMLVTQTAVLPPPQQPGFYMERSSNEKHSSQDGETFSINDTSITVVGPR